MMDVNNDENPTGTLATKFLNPAGEENMYVKFGYGPNKFLYHTLKKYHFKWRLVQSTLSNKSTINNVNIETKTTKEITLN